MSRLFGVVLMLFLVGCNQTIPLKKEVYNDISSVDTLVIFPQDKINVTRPATPINYQLGAFGAMAVAMVDTLAQQREEQQRAPIVAKMESHDFRTSMKASLETEFGKVERVSFKVPFEVSRVKGKEEKLAFLQKSDQDAVMLMSVSYQLLSGRLVIYVDVDMYPRSEPLKRYSKRFDSADLLSDGNLIYRMGFRYNGPEVTEENVISTLEEAMLKIAEYVAKNLSTPVE